MRIRTLASWPALLLLAVAPAISQTTDSTPYVLEPASHFEIGCEGPCACPVVDYPLSGGFSLTPSGFDPLYSYYDLSNIDWKFATASGVIHLTGKGRYQLGGEFAIMHRLTLDLIVDGQPQHYDSGLVQGGGEWPAIRISCAVHGFACYDTVAVVDAKPANTAAVGGSPRERALLRAAGPNPAHGASALLVTLHRPGSVDLRVFDPAGRLVRVLLRGTMAGPGSRTVPWNGLRDDGRPAPPGLYLARLVAPEGSAWCRLVRLR